MARKKTPADNFRKRLDDLSNAITDDLRLPSLEENRLAGYAYLFRLVLPLLSAKGIHVFTDPIHFADRSPVDVTQLTDFTKRAGSRL
jgi:hypothetical protein